MTLVFTTNTNSKSPFVVHIEKNHWIHSSSRWFQQQLRPLTLLGNKTNTDTRSVSANVSDKHPNDSTEPRISVLAFGKRVASRVRGFSSAFDLRSLDRSKFCVSFSEWSSANKFIRDFDSKRNNLFKSEPWLAYIPNYKVIKQYIIKGIDDDDSEEDVKLFIRPHPEWGSFWTPPVWDLSSQAEGFREGYGGRCW